MIQTFCHACHTLFDEEVTAGKTTNQRKQIVFNIPEEALNGIGRASPKNNTGKLKLNINDDREEVGISTREGKRNDQGTVSDKKRKGEDFKRKRTRTSRWWQWKTCCYFCDKYSDDDNADYDPDDESSDQSDDDISTENPTVKDLLRLLLIAFFATFVAGLVPGQALWIRMLSDYGVYSSECDEGQHVCLKQQLAVAAAFDVVQSITYFGSLPAGYLFDRLGGRMISSVGALFTYTGMLMIEFPLLGAAYGYDKFTSRVFPLALILTDVGSTFSNYCILSMVYHFPNSHMMLLAVMIMQQQVAAVLPNAFQYVQHAYALDLPTAFALFSVVSFTAFVGLLLVAPSQKEYREQAKRVTGAEPKNSNGFWRDFRETCKIIRVHWFDHLWFSVAAITTHVYVIVYPSILGTYIQLIRGSQREGDDFASLTTLLIGTLGTLISVVVGIAVDRAGTTGLYVVPVVIFGLLVISAFNLLVPSAFSQYACMLCVIGMSSLETPLLTKYCVSHVPPRHFGTFSGVLGTVVMFGFTFETIWFFEITAAANTADELGFNMLVINAIACTVLISWALRQFAKGLPRKPPMLHDNNTERGRLTHSLL